MSTIFNSNSEAEREFSVQMDVHRNPKCNMMLQETLEVHMQVHYGVESQQSKESCSTCSKYQAAKTRPPHHCHCSVAEISDTMKEDCKSARRVEESQQDLAKVAPAASAIIQEKAVKAKQEAECRMLKFVTKLKTRSTFYSADLMTRVFASSNDNGDDEDDVPSTSKST